MKHQVSIRNLSQFKRCKRASLKVFYMRTDRNQPVISDLLTHSIYFGQRKKKEIFTYL
jgi:hypothetical protein